MADSLKYRRLRARGFSSRLARLWANRNFTLGGTNAVGNRASLVTGTGNGRILWIARVPGAAGNSYSVTFVNPATANAPLTVSNVNGAVTVNLATNGSSVVTSTANDVVKAIKAAPQTGALQYVWPEILSPGADGTGVQAALATTNLAGGS